ncbi:MAG: hypothetical protein QXY87_11070 [Saccharolobus sp.]|uniref:hypothetical protein n=1 Tax=Saccharolobus TaxID=2100760 RepID=UPI001F0F36E1|nr:hypothetical protein [Saccharolobus shibatae]MCH4816158.1 hypothetical protein [Saccharolobus shibatae]
MLTDVMQPSLKKEFDENIFASEKPFSKIISLEEVKELVIGNIERSLGPIIVEGPFGSGKTQLLFELFKYFWKNKIPTLFINLEKLVSDIIKEDDGKKELVELIKTIIFKKYKFILGNLNSKASSEDAYLPITYAGSEINKLEDLFKIIPLDKSKVEEYIKNVFNDRPTVLLIDEVENGYTKLLDLLNSKETSLRDFIDNCPTLSYLL